MNKFVIILILSALFFSLGCIEGNDLVIPYSTSQFLARSTDLNYTQFIAGDYNGLCLRMDGNLITADSCSDVNAVLDWDNMFNFPAGCGAGQAVQVIGTILTCIDLIPDTNFETAGYTAAQILLDTNAETACGDSNYLRGDGTCQPMASGGSQTPWTSNINANGYDLDNIGDITSKSDEGDLIIKNLDQDNDILLQVNDGGTERTAIQINGDEGSVTMPRQSYVIAHLYSSDQVIGTSAWTNVVFNTEVTDRLGEYDPATGIFTAKDTGVYSINAQILYRNVNPAISHYIRIFATSSIYPAVLYYAGNTMGYYPLQVHHNLHVTAGNTIKIQTYQSSGGNESLLGTNPYYTCLTITKVS